MKYSAALAAVSLALGVSAQGVETGIAPEGGSPEGCMLTAPGRYQVQNVKTMARRGLEKRAVDCSDSTALIVELNDGILTDAASRIGQIVANRQFQFDGPPAQAGAIYTGGWSMCSNGSLAIGPTTIFYQCKSGDFFNIYDQPSGAGCIQIRQQLLECSDNSTASSSSAAVSGATSSLAPVATMSDGQPTASSATLAVSQITDGQPQATSAGVSQISDGQPQATSPSNATVTTSPPIATGGAAQYVASGAVVVVGAVAALLL